MLQSDASDTLVTPSKDRGDAQSLRVILERELRSERWRTGERLPTERELSEKYGVARNTVRRALEALEDAQLVVRHVGRGTFKAQVTNAGGDPAIGIQDLETLSPADVVECRLMFEPELAALVVARANQADFDRMDECLRNADAATTLVEFELWDAALHDAIALASRNHAMISVARSLARVRRHYEWGRLKSRSMTAERMTMLRDEHRRIVEALKVRDKDLARERLRAHIRHVQAYMFDE